MKKIGEGGFGVIYPCDIHSNCVCKRFSNPEDYLIELFFICWIGGDLFKDALWQSLSIHMKRYETDLYNCISDLKEAEKKEICDQLKVQIERIHERGVAHGDIRPENILINRKEKTEVCLTDFSLSIMIPYTTRLLSISPPYAGGSDYVSVENDLFAFEIVKCEIENGKLFDRKDSIKLDIQILKTNHDFKIPLNVFNKIKKFDFINYQWIEEMSTRLELPSSKLPITILTSYPLRPEECEMYTICSVLISNLVTSNSVLVSDLSMYLSRQDCLRIGSDLCQNLQS